MKRKILSILLVLVLCLSLVISISAAPDADFVFDELDYLADSEIASLNAVAGKIYDERNIGLFFVYTTADSLMDYDISKIVGSMENYYVMMENDTSWHTFAGGLGKNIDADTEETLRGVYDDTDTYVAGVEAFFLAAKEHFPVITDTPVVDTSDVQEAVLFDEADLLTDQEEAQLTQKLLAVSHKHQAQIVISTISSMEDGDINRFVETLYDGMGYGYGENHDGVLLLVCMDPREYRILSNGFAGDAIQADEIDAIGSAVETNLSGGNYEDAFETYIDRCDYYLDGHLNGFPFDFAKNFIISLLIGIVAGVVVALILKGQLKSVRKQNQANVYVKPGSMQLTTSNDFFLYRTVDRTKKESSSSSSSGSSRNVGGGSF